MLINTLFAGFGGQGVLSMGLNLAQAAMAEDKNVTYWPSYGVEVRGGTANCTVTVSDEEIASPVSSTPDFVVAMNRPSVVRFQNQVQSGGALIYNSSLVEIEISRGDIEILAVPASEIAEELGNSKTTNMIMLGALVKKGNLVSLSTLIEGLKDTFKKKEKLIAINEKALTAGYNLF